MKYYTQNQCLAWLALELRFENHVIYKSEDLLLSRYFHSLLAAKYLHYLLVPLFSWLYSSFSVCELLHSQMVSSSQVFWNFPMEDICIALFSFTVSDTSSIWVSFFALFLLTVLSLLYLLCSFFLELLLFGYWVSWIDPYV